MPDSVTTDLTALLRRGAAAGAGHQPAGPVPDQQRGHQLHRQRPAGRRAPRRPWSTSSARPDRSPGSRRGSWSTWARWRPASPTPCVEAADGRRARRVRRGCSTRWRSARCRSVRRWPSGWSALRPTVVRGNASEIIAVAGLGGGGRGVDATAGVEDAAAAATALAERTGGVVAVSGPGGPGRRRGPVGPGGQRRPAADQGDRRRLRARGGDGRVRRGGRRPAGQHRGRGGLLHRRRRAGRRAERRVRGRSRWRSWTRWPRSTPADRGGAGAVRCRLTCRSIWSPTNRQAAAAGHDLADLVAAAVAGGVTAVQVREKQADAGEFLDTVLKVAAVLPEPVALFVNDRVDVFLAARHAGARVTGVHVGQQDLPVGGRPGPGRTGRADRADREHPGRAVRGRSGGLPGGLRRDRLGARHGQQGRRRPGAGGGRASPRWPASTFLPAVAIGGITVRRPSPGLRAGGAAGVAVISAICGATDPRAASARLARAWAAAA